MGQILKPHRGKASTMAGDKSATVLEEGEMFLEYPNGGVGSGLSKIKIGNGSTQYKDLPYAFGDTSNEVVNYNENVATTLALILNSAASGSSISSIVAALKAAINLLDGVDSTIKENATNTTDTINSKIDALSTRVDNMVNVKISVIESGSNLPNTGTLNTIYFVDQTNPGTTTGNDVYDRYIWQLVSSTGTEGYYNKNGSSTVDLSLYDKIADRQSADSALDAKISSLTTTVNSKADASALGTQVTYSLSG